MVSPHGHVKFPWTRLVVSIVTFPTHFPQLPECVGWCSGSRDVVYFDFSWDGGLSYGTSGVVSAIGTPTPKETGGSAVQNACRSLRMDGKGRVPVNLDGRQFGEAGSCLEVFKFQLVHHSFLLYKELQMRRCSTERHFCE